MKDLITSCETWLSQSVFNREVLPESYRIYRKDRNDGYGGVLIGIKNQYQSELIITDEDCEMCAVKVNTSTIPSSTLILISVYRPPNRDIPKYHLLCDAIYNMVSSYPNVPIYCAGDFNLPDISWNTNSVSGHQYPLELNNMTLELLFDCGLTQIFELPT